jgi:FKBP-type peptidyl-prolyl cis-trans isomerase
MASSTGLWYPESLENAANHLSDGDIVRISNKISLLNGRHLDSVSAVRPVTYTVGRASLGTGIEEGLKMMTTGAETTFIVPPHLAQGNFGDHAKIPPGAILIVEMRLHGKVR